MNIWREKHIKQWILPVLIVSLIEKLPVSFSCVHYIMNINWRQIKGFDWIVLEELHPMLNYRHKGLNMRKEVEPWNIWIKKQKASNPVYEIFLKTFKLLFEKRDEYTSIKISKPTYKLKIFLVLKNRNIFWLLSTICACSVNIHANMEIYINDSITLHGCDTKIAFFF